MNREGGKHSTGKANKFHLGDDLSLKDDDHEQLLKCSSETMMDTFKNKAGMLHALHSSTFSRAPCVVIMKDKLQFRILMLESWLVLVYLRQSKGRPPVQLPSPWHSQLVVTVTVVPGNV